MAAISGGAVSPPMTDAVVARLQKKSNKKPFHTAMLIPMMGFILAWIVSPVLELKELIA